MPEPAQVVLSEQLHIQIDDKRCDAQMSYKALALHLGVPSSVFAKLARGASSEDTYVEVICAWLGMPTAWFFESPNQEAYTRELSRISRERMRLRGEQVLAKFGR